jgi:hypothetical protein
MNSRHATALLLSLLVSGCHLFPQVIVGQKTVPPPVEKRPEQLEAERKAARLVADKITAPAALVPVARELSNSLGQPLVPLITNDLPNAAQKIVETLRAENARLATQNEKQRAFLRKYAGNKIEDTGFDVGGLLSGSGMLAFIAVLIFVPGAFGFFLFTIRRLRSTLGGVITAVEQHRVEDPAAVQSFEGWAKDNLSAVERTIVDKLKSKIPAQKILEAHEYVNTAKA